MLHKEPPWNELKQAFWDVLTWMIKRLLTVSLVTSGLSQWFALKMPNYLQTLTNYSLNSSETVKRVTQKKTVSLPSK